MALIHGLHQRNIRGDLLGGLTAAVVALPLALAFGNAALGPGGAIYGLYGAIATGFLAALLGGTPAQVSGPTGPMSVTVAGIVSSLAAIFLQSHYYINRTPAPFTAPIPADSRLHQLLSPTRLSPRQSQILFRLVITESNRGATTI